MKISLKKNLKIFKEVLFYVLIIFLIITASLNFYSRLSNQRSSILGYSPLIVVTPSMEPTYKINEFLILKNVDINSIEEGDIISFMYDINDDDTKELLTHRVENINYTQGEVESIITKGDANTATEEILPEDFEGRIIYNSFFLGNSLSFLIEKNILIILIGGFFSFLIVKQFISVIYLIKENKKQI